MITPRSLSKRHPLLTVKRPIVFSYWIQLALLCLTLCCAPFARAWVRDSWAPWPSGTVTLKVMLGTTPMAGSNKTANQRAVEGITQWNQYLGRIQLATVEAAPGTGQSNNSINEVWFANSYAGTQLSSDVLGLTIIRASGGVRREADIIVNSNFDWVFTETYSAWYGNLRSTLTHETGHLLGLGHPNEAGQSVRSVMNTSVRFDDATDDDQEGVASMYGPGPRTHVVEFSKHPETVECEVGDGFSVQAQANTDTYQWYRNGVSLGAAGSSYSFSGIASSETAGEYTVKASNPWKSAMSNPASVIVYATPQPPFITKDLKDVSVQEGEGVMFQVAYRSRSEVSYRWFKNDVVLPQTFSYLSLSDLQPEDEGLYRVELTNSAGTRRSYAARLTITPPPPPIILSSGSTNRTIRGGSQTQVAIETRGVNLSFKWYKDGVLVATDRGFSIGYQGVLTKSVWESADSGVYRCVVSNRGGSVSSADITLNVTELSVPVPFIFPRRVAATVFDSFVIRALNRPSYEVGTRFQWFKDGVPVTSDGNREGLTVYHPQIRDSGFYWLEISNDAGTVRCNPVFCDVVSPLRHVPVAVKSGVLYAPRMSGWYIGRTQLSDLSVLEPIGLNRMTDILVPDETGLIVSRYASPTLDTLAHYRINDQQITNLGDPYPKGKVFAAQTTGSLIVGYSVSETGQAQVVRRDSATGLVTVLRNSNGDTLVDLVVSEKAGRVFMLFSHFGRYGTYSFVSSMLLDGTGSLDAHQCRSHPSALFLASNDTLLVDDTGEIRLADSLAFVDRLPVSPNDLVGLPGGANLVLSQDKLLFYSESMKFVRGITAPENCGRLLAEAGKVYGLCLENYTSKWVSVDLEAPTTIWSDSTTAGNLVASGMPLRSESVFVGADGLVYLLDGGQGGLFAWSATTREIIHAIPLEGRPTRAVHLPALNSVYLQYEEGRVTRVRLESGAREEAFIGPFAEVRGMVGRGTKLALFVSAQTSAGDVVVIDGDTGALMHSGESSLSLAGSKYQTWVEARNELIWSYSGYASGLLVCPAAAAGEGFDFSNLKNVQLSDTPTYGSDESLFVNHAGTRCLLFSGFIVDLAGRSSLAQLPFGQHFGLWTGANGDTLHTLSLEGPGTRLTRWSEDYRIKERSVLLDFSASHLIALTEGRLLVVGHRRGALRLLIVDADLKQLSLDGTGVPSRLSNMSVQADVGVGDDILVPGFVIKGAGSKNILVRAVGPGLAQFNVSNLLPDPQLTLFNSKSMKFAENDNWQSVGAPGLLLRRMQDLRAFDLPLGSKDASFLGAVAPGLYTAEARDKASVSGRAIVELYDADEAPGDVQLVNMSARCKVGAKSVVVGGFVVEGDRTKKVLLRAVGPTLADFNVGGVLGDPKLTLFRDQTVLARNDNWSTSSEDQRVFEAAFGKTGAFPLSPGSKDAVIMMELPAGNYTVWMESADGSSGVALFEAYLVE